MDWLIVVGLPVLSVYLLAGAVVIMWALGMARHAPLPWYYVVWLVVTWPRVFWSK